MTRMPEREPTPDADPFVEYYAKQSLSPTTMERFRATMDMLLRVRTDAGLHNELLSVIDIGCNAGEQSMMWAREGHRVHGLDINEKLLDIARQRSAERDLDIDFRVGTATALPWESQSMDVCVMPELLEHVADWEPCVNEASRVLRPGGVLYLSTTNWLCPLQSEFELPLYSWYPPPLKRYCEKLSVTTHPEWVNHASYPAVHWFSPYQLGRHLKGSGFTSLDRFDLMNLENKSGAVRAAVKTIRAVPPLRLMAHVATPYTVLVALKH